MAGQADDNAPGLDPEQQQAGERTYRISELVEASGASRDMIKYYLRSGLLPAAQKPRANLALYTSNHLELIGLIRKFQEQTRLSLPQIAAVFGRADYDANAIEIELLWNRQGAGDDDNIIPLVGDAANLRGPSVPAEFLQQLVEAGLQNSDALPGAPTDQQTDQQAALLWAAHDAGVPLTFFQAARDKLAELADLEVKALITIKRPGLDFNDTVQNVVDVDRLVNRWLIGEKNSQIRRQFQRVIDNSERAISTLLDTIYRPSDLFRARYGVDEALASLAEAAQSGPLSPESSHELASACILLGDYELAIAVAESTLAAYPDDELANAVIALAHGVQNNVDAAFEYSSRLDEAQAEHPEILQARILSLLLKAAKLRGVADTNDMLKRAATLFLQLPRGVSPEQAEAILLLARANVAFPDFANSRPEAIRALRALLEHVDGGLVGSSLAGLRDCLTMVQRIYVLYYLGVLYTMEGEEGQARDCFEQVVQIDPACNFSETAYLTLGQSR